VFTQLTAKSDTSPAQGRADATQGHPEPVWTEGICGDGAAILRDGVMQPIEDVLAALNATSLAQPEPVAASERIWH
jgi:hypothetical protein